MDTIQKVLKKIGNNLQTLENDLKNAADVDQATEGLEAFCKNAQAEYTLLVTMNSKLESLNSDLAEYFVFDKLKYSLEQFFMDIKQFKDQFKQVKV